MQTTFEVISHAGFTVVKKIVGKNILEVDTRRPNTVYMQYGYLNGTGPWSSTSAIHYGNNKYGYDTPGAWNKKTRAMLPKLFAMVEKIKALE